MIESSTQKTYQPEEERKLMNKTEPVQRKRSTRSKCVEKLQIVWFCNFNLEINN